MFKKNRLFFLAFLTLHSLNVIRSLDNNDDLGQSLILKTGEGNTVILGDRFLQNTYENNKSLKSSDANCFNIMNLRNSQFRKDELKKLGGSSFIIKNRLNKDIRCSFIDRHSDKLLIIGGGFPVERHKMLPFVKLFSDYDLVLFDYRGVGEDYCFSKSSFLFPWKWKGLISKLIVHVDINTSNFGIIEEDDVIDVVKNLKSEKTYSKVFGFGLCFSTYTFAKAAAVEPDLFDKLIFDASWPSLYRVMKTIIQKPSLVFSSHNPHSPLPAVTNTEFYQNLITWLFEFILGVNLEKTKPLSYYLSQIQCPILFIQGIEDCYCDLGEFNQIWEASKSLLKAVVLTQNSHGRNHLWQPWAYKEITNKFLDLSFAKFIEHLFLLNG